MAVFIIIALQYLVSAKAGFVNYVDGQANVQIHQQVSEGMPIETAARSHVEVLLNPGSFLRLGEQSRVVFDSIDLTNIALRVLDGAAMIEVAEVDKHMPIRVLTGNLQTVIVSSGLYRFSGDTAVVVDGKLRTVDSSKTVKKGQQITSTSDGYVESRTALAFADGLDRWSAQRSSDVARANVLAYRSYSAGSVYAFGGYSPYFLSGSSWFYSPLLSGFTFVPIAGYRSYYGYRFVPLSSFGTAPIRPGRSAPSIHSSTRRTGSASHGPTTSHSSLAHSRGGHMGGGRK